VLPRPLALLALALAALTHAPRPLQAQRVLAPTLDATTLRRGVLRTTVELDNVLLRGRWADGEAQALGAGLSTPLDASNNVTMRGIGDVFSLLGRPDVTTSLGTTRTDLRQRLAVTRLGFEYGLTDRIGLRVQAPFVRARAEASMTLDGSGASAGLNPTLQGTDVAAANRAVVDAYAAAVAALTQRRDDCAGNPAAHPECATITAELASVNAAIARGSQFATALSTIYGAQGLDAGLRYVPMANSAAEAALRGVGNALRIEMERWGVTDVDTTTGFPLGAQAPITADELASLVTAPVAAGLGAQPLRRSTRQDLGDVDLTLRVNLFDAFPTDSARAAANRFGLRSTLALTYRVGLGNFDLPDNLIDLGTGSGHDALAVHAITDVIVNARFWTTASLGWARAAEHERIVRVPLLAGVDLIGADREVPVRITPADLLELRLAPRWSLNDYLGLGGEWRYRTRGRDRVVAVEDPAVLLPPGATLPYGDGAIQTPSDSDEHRWAWTLSYSTLGSQARGNARLPFELFYSHEQSVGSSRGIVPRRWEDRIQFRFYTRLFGR
jgi:hypothetical protein